MMKRTEGNTRTNKTMINAEEEAGKAEGTEKEPTIVEPVEEEVEVVPTEAEEEAEGATTTTTMVE